MAFPLKMYSKFSLTKIDFGWPDVEIGREMANGQLLLLGLYMYVCMYVCIYAHIYVCMYICTYICMYVLVVCDIDNMNTYIS